MFLGLLVLPIPSTLESRQRVKYLLLDFTEEPLVLKVPQILVLSIFSGDADCCDAETTPREATLWLAIPKDKPFFFFFL